MSHFFPLSSSKKLTLTAITVAICGSWLASCSTQPPAPPATKPLPPVKPPVIVQSKPPVVRPTPPVTTTVPAVRYPTFASWKSDFIQRSMANGVNGNDLQRLLGDAEYNAQVVSSDKNQAEFAKMPWEYLDGVLASSRVTGGQQKYNSLNDLLMGIENRFGVPASIVTAIWGMESSYGGFTGNSSLANSLSTLAYDGRRQAFAESQLLALLQLVERGDIDWSQLKGSWAGGMGHTQFIPRTWLDEGVDGDGDGHRNPWNSADALSSTASYLSRSGWQRGLPTFYEVRLPTGFDYRQVSSKKTVADWQRLGVQFLTAPVSGNSVTELWLPAGKEGPALLLTQNFDAIKVYNNSANYALGVSLLAKAIVGQGELQADFPRYERPLANYQVVQLQERLTRLGFDTKGTDGVIGNNTKLAFQRWQAANGQIPDGFITQRSAAMLVQ